MCVNKVVQGAPKMTGRFFATKRSVFVGRGSPDVAYKVLTKIMRNTGLMRKVRKSSKEPFSYCINLTMVWYTWGVVDLTCSKMWSLFDF